MSSDVQLARHYFLISVAAKLLMRCASEIKHMPHCKALEEHAVNHVAELYAEMERIHDEREARKRKAEQGRRTLHKKRKDGRSRR